MLCGIQSLVLALVLGFFPVLEKMQDVHNAFPTITSAVERHLKSQFELHIVDKIEGPLSEHVWKYDAFFRQKKLYKIEEVLNNSK